MSSITETVSAGRVIRRSEAEVMSLSTREGRLVITCHTCTMNDGRRVEIVVAPHLSRECLAVMRLHADDCHR